VAWINLAQNMDQLWTPVNKIMNIWFPQKVDNFLTSCATISC